MSGNIQVFTFSKTENFLCCLRASIISPVSLSRRTCGAVEEIRVFIIIKKYFTAKLSQIKNSKKKQNKNDFPNTQSPFNLQNSGYCVPGRRQSEGNCTCLSARFTYKEKPEKGKKPSLSDSLAPKNMAQKVRS